MQSFKINKSITDRSIESIGLYFKDVSRNKVLSAEEEAQLYSEIKKGNKKAIDKLITANLRFVISVAKKYQGNGLSLVDLIQEGNLGLIKAAEVFDPDRGIKFISYAVWWIRQSIMKALSDQSRTIRLPLNQISCLSKVNKISEKFEQTHNRKPSVNELEDIINIPANKLNMSMALTGSTVSLDSKIKDDSESTLVDIIPDSCKPSDYDTGKNDLPRTIRTILDTLSNRDSDILRMAFGIDMFPMPLTEVASKFGIGYERARQLQQATLKKIREKYYKPLQELL